MVGVCLTRTLVFRGGGEGMEGEWGGPSFAEREERERNENCAFNKTKSLDVCVCDSRGGATAKSGGKKKACEMGGLKNKVAKRSRAST